MFIYIYIYVPFLFADFVPVIGGIYCTSKKKKKKEKVRNKLDFMNHEKDLFPQLKRKLFS